MVPSRELESESRVKLIGNFEYWVSIDVGFLFCIVVMVDLSYKKINIQIVHERDLKTKNVSPPLCDPSRLSRFMLSFRLLKC